MSCWMRRTPKISKSSFATRLILGLWVSRLSRGLWCAQAPRLQSSDWAICASRQSCWTSLYKHSNWTRLCTNCRCKVSTWAHAVISSRSLNSWNTITWHSWTSPGWASQPRNQQTHGLTWQNTADTSRIWIFLSTWLTATPPVTWSTKSLKICAHFSLSSQDWSMLTWRGASTEIVLWRSLRVWLMHTAYRQFTWVITWRQRKAKPK